MEHTNVIEAKTFTHIASIMHELGSQSTFWHAASCATVLSLDGFYTRFLVARCVCVCVASTCWFCYIRLRNENHVFIVQHVKKMAWRCENGTRAQEKTKYKKSFIDSSTFCASTNEEKKMMTMKSCTSPRQISTRQTPKCN